MGKDERIPSIGPVLGALAAGVALGMLFAPKKGSELRADLGDMLRRNQDKARSLAGKIGERLPGRLKIAAGLGAVNGVAAEALREVKEKTSSALNA